MSYTLESLESNPNDGKDGQSFDISESERGISMTPDNDLTNQQEKLTGLDVEDINSDTYFLISERKN